MMNQRPKNTLHVLSLLTLSLLLSGACNTSTGDNLGAGSTAQGDALPAAPAADSAVTAQRAIEEADVVKIDGHLAYVLNRYKGLIIIDVTNPDAPNILSTLDLRGSGVEMYVAPPNLYVILSADFGYAPGVPIGARVALPVDPPPPDFSGSRLAVIDVSDPAHPASKGKINLAGFVSQSRRVGDVIYVVGDTQPSYILYASDSAGGSSSGNSSSGDVVPPSAPASQPVPPQQEGFVASVNITDPTNIIPKEHKSITGNGLQIHVSQTTIFAASQNYDSNSATTATSVQAIDITDPAGAIALRGTFTVPGFIPDRFAMDDFSGVFRIATQSAGFGFPKVRIFTYDLTDLDHVTQMGSVDIIQNESLRAARFDGPRGYVVTFFQKDPLFVVDLHDPAAPTVSGKLTVPGFSTHLEPRDDRLIAVGIDDTDGSRPAIAYYNVADPANPTQIGRIVLGPPGSFTESQATYDDKAFKIIDELGLIVVPFRHSDSNGVPVPVSAVGTTNNASAGPNAESSPGSGVSAPNLPSCINGVQLVDFSDDALTQRGSFEHPGMVERVGAVGGRIFALSQAAFQTVDITDRDNPKKAGEADFFSADQIDSYANDCFLFIEEPPIGTGPSPLDGLFALLNNLCGTTGVPALAAMPLGLLAMRRRYRRKMH